jgi:voltage-dependent calcium channel R type alpha-1E
LVLVKHRYFENIILLLIAVSTINLALEEPLDDPLSQKNYVLQLIDYVMTAIFTFEMLAKNVTYGFAFCGETSYIRNGWNILDCFIVLSSLFSLNPNAGEQLKVLKILRILRVLRPLRMVSRNRGLKISITALVNSLPSIFNLQMIIFFFLFLLGILHTTLFGGGFWQCSYDHLIDNGSMSYEQTQVVIKSKWDCINNGGEWINSDYNFDNTLLSI